MPKCAVKLIRRNAAAGVGLLVLVLTAVGAQSGEAAITELHASRSLARACFSQAPGVLHVRDYAPGGSTTVGLEGDLLVEFGVSYDTAGAIISFERSYGEAQKSVIATSVPEDRVYRVENVTVDWGGPSPSSSYRAVVMNCIGQASREQATPILTYAASAATRACLTRLGAKVLNVPPAYTLGSVDLDVYLADKTELSLSFDPTYGAAQMTTTSMTATLRSTKSNLLHYRLLNVMVLWGPGTTSPLERSTVNGCIERTAR